MPRGLAGRHEVPRAAIFRRAVGPRRARKVCDRRCRRFVRFVPRGSRARDHRRYPLNFSSVFHIGTVATWNETAALVLSNSGRNHLAARPRPHRDSLPHDTARDGMNHSGHGQFGSKITLARIR